MTTCLTQERQRLQAKGQHQPTRHNDLMTSNWKPLRRAKPNALRHYKPSANINYNEQHPHREAQLQPGYHSPLSIVVRNDPLIMNHPSQGDRSKGNPDAT
jgi:hypothetical protein